MTVAGLPVDKSVRFVNTVNDSKMGKDATMCLSGVKDKRAIESLINKVTDKDKEVRRGAVLALGVFKDEWAFKHLRMLIKDKNEDTSIRSQAIVTMSQMDSKKAVEIFIGVVLLKST